MKVKKIRDYYTLDVELYNKFLKYIEDNKLNKSKLLESLVNDFMKNKN
jgi:hypothetical protein